MPQFTVHRNQHAPSKARFPLLLDIQADFLKDLATRVVIPLAPQSSSMGQRMNRLTPLVQVEGKRYVVVTPQLSAIAKKELGPAVADLTSDRIDFINALDFLLTGI
jgi:toxin CcdB